MPPIGAAMDRGLTQDQYWKPLFDGYQPARDWMAAHRPDVALIVYSDHANAFDIDMVPTFAIGTAGKYQVADEGFGRRPVPDVIGAPELSEDYIREAGSEGIELIMWLIMRGALNQRVRRVHRTYHVPASNTAAGLALFDNRGGAGD